MLQIRGNWVGDAWSGYVQIDGQVAVNSTASKTTAEQCALMFTNGEQADIGCGSMAPFLCSL